MKRAAEWLAVGEEKLGQVESRTLRTTSLRQVAHDNASLLSQGMPLEWVEETSYSIPRLHEVERPKA